MDEYKIWTGRRGQDMLNAAFRFDAMHKSDRKALRRGRLVRVILGARRGLLAVDERGYIWCYEPGRGWKDEPDAATLVDSDSRPNPRESRFNRWEKSL